MSLAPVTQETPTNSSSDMFRPPVNRAMRVLDRSFFKKTVPLSAATVLENKNISRVKSELTKSNDMLALPRILPIRKPQVIKNEDDEARKCLLLREGVKADDVSTWSPTIEQLVEAKTVEVNPFDLQLDYDYWTYPDIISAILPEDELGETPVGFSQVGHIAHLNLRDQYLPYRHLIAEILMDKNTTVRTVINKIDDVGATSEFRTFAFEVLAGENNTNVIAHEQDCEFSFDFAKVYWNSRLSTEHTRLVSTFKEGEAVCDVMAGVGPFALPAAKKRVFVWANDLNPHGYERMVYGMKKNKVQEFMKAFNMNGRDFVKYAAKSLYEAEPAKVVIKPKISRSAQKEKRSKSPDRKTPPPQVYTSPRTFDHYIMNLPASAITFLDTFIGVYAGQEQLFAPHTDRRLPLIHVYCFSTNSDDGEFEKKEICERISKQIGFTITPEDCEGGTGNKEREVEIRSVRLVSPNKRMFCAKFRLPEEVAFKKD
ncbi:tRNA methyltransferase Trm5 [Coccidioides immitis RS]|uniref:tRNA (guanine(37)-N1)-methyltransferase n=1 Tax=Coccidioides immitis (strain RS) TaxID=246410 RepID=J3KL71_COCIM|nr:tRNA methyltransferase Trm5 [Coccidioides immitis RS]EAS37001.3 tRNA methyltransferase Trm5 [Coccidioides immitis RS]